MRPSQCVPLYPRLQGCTVFLDLDGDRAQGSGEPSGVTSASGAFSIAINEVTPLP